MTLRLVRVRDWMLVAAVVSTTGLLGMFVYAFAVR